MGLEGNEEKTRDLITVGRQIGNGESRFNSNTSLKVSDHDVLKDNVLNDMSNLQTTGLTKHSRVKSIQPQKKKKNQNLVSGCSPTEI